MTVVYILAGADLVVVDSLLHATTAARWAGAS